uniref:NADH-ubiquinone oxidoreductase chain 6 n=1 Tax=Ctenocephalides felis felis TaxID=986163 RepID=A0A8F5A635_CTEFE|nr:NADH dehydrogenase subunit 6 [Ctenocephalides felis felis]QXG83127.1 NADH dehydrogenase subunit 6 [Ctenocephalides felis felis]
MKLLFFMGILYSLIFFMVMHPLSLGLMLIIQTIWTSMFIGLISKTFWFSYILFISFIGGMLILFIYMTSISNTEYFSLNIYKTIFITLLLTLSIIIYYNKNFLLIFNNNSMFNDFNSNLLMYNFNLNKLYNFPNNLLTIMLIIYLLISLICVVKITDIFYGPLRKNF